GDSRGLPSHRAGSPPNAAAANRNGPACRQAEPRNFEDSESSVFLRRQDLAALVHAGLQVDVVRALQFAGFLVLDEGVGAERVMRAAHVAPRGRGFAFRNGHRKLILAWKWGRVSGGRGVSGGLCMKGPPRSSS